MKNSGVSFNTQQNTGKFNLGKVSGTYAVNKQNGKGAIVIPYGVFLATVTFNMPGGQITNFDLKATRGPAVGDVNIDTIWGANGGVQLVGTGSISVFGKVIYSRPIEADLSTPLDFARAIGFKPANLFGQYAQTLQLAIAQQTGDAPLTTTQTVPSNGFFFYPDNGSGKPAPLLPAALQATINAQRAANAAACEAANGYALCYPNSYSRSGPSINVNSSNGDVSAGGVGTGMVDVGGSTGVTQMIAGAGAVTVLGGSGNNTIVGNPNGTLEYIYGVNVSSTGQSSSPEVDTIIPSNTIGTINYVPSGGGVEVELTGPGKNVSSVLAVQNNVDVITWTDPTNNTLYTFNPIYGPTLGILTISHGVLGNGQIIIQDFDLTQAETPGGPGFLGIHLGMQLDVSTNTGINPLLATGGGSLNSTVTAQGGEQPFTIYTSVPSTSPQTLTLSASGGNASQDYISFGSQILSLAGGPITLVVPAGQDRITVGLIDPNSSTTSQTVQLTATLSGNAATSNSLTVNFAATPTAGSSTVINGSQIIWNNPNSPNYVAGYPIYYIGSGIAINNATGLNTNPLYNGQNALYFQLDGNADSVTASGMINDIYNPLANGNSTINGGGAQNVIVTGNGSNKIFGGTTSTLNAALAQLSSAVATNAKGDFVGVGNGDNTIVGSNGNDAIVVGTGHNIIICGAGADSIIGGETASAANLNWSTTSSASAGSTLITYNNVAFTPSGFSAGGGYEGATVVINGVAQPVGTGNDTIFGGSGNSYFWLANGNNFLNTGNGNDEVQASTGSSTIIGGTGNDSIFGGGGNNYIVAGSGSDIIDGEGGNVTIVGGTGNDVIYSGNGWSSSWATSETGNGYLIAGSGNTQLSGAGGNDTLFGGAGNDSLFAGAGSESLVAGSGATYMVAGAGNDTIVCGSGNDSINAGLGNETVYGGTGVDTIFGSAGSALIYAGNGGTDSALTNIIAGNGATTIYGGDGVDNIVGGAGNDILYAGDGGDATVATRVVAGSGNTIIYGGAGYDQLNAGGGNDTMIAGAGTTVFNGSVAGVSTYVVGANSGNVTINNAGSGDVLEFGSGITIANLTSSETSYTNGNLITFKTSEGQTISLALGALSTVEFADGETTTVANLLSPEFNVGQIAYSTVNNALSQVSLTSVSTPAALSASNTGSTRNNVASATQYLILTGSSDIFGAGNNVNDVIQSNSGNDTLIAGTANNTLIGGGTSDDYVVGAGVGTVTTIQESAATDTLTFAAGINYTNLSVAVIAGSNGNNITLNVAQNGSVGGGSVVIQGSKVGYLDQLQFADGSTASLGQMIAQLTSGPTATTSSTTVTLAEGIQNMTLTGTTGVTATGNDQDNVITASNTANDTLVAGTGSDTFIGGLGTTTYTISAEGANVTINKSGANDVLVYGTGITESDITTTRAVVNGITVVTLTDALGGTVTVNSGTLKDVVFGDGSTATFSQLLASSYNMTPTTYSAVSTTLGSGLTNLVMTGNQNVVAIGNNLNDSIQANSGDDTLVAGSGNDTLTGNDNAGNNCNFNEGANTGSVTIQNSTSHDTLSMGGTGLAAIAATISSGGYLDVTLTDSLGGTVVVDGSSNGLLDQIQFANGASASLSQLVAQLTSGPTAATSSTTITLAPGIQNMKLTGTGISGSANSLDNVITAGAGNDTLISGAGNVTMVGGVGNTTYDVNAGCGNVTINGSGGSDEIVFGGGITEADVTASSAVVNGTTVITIADSLGGSIQINGGGLTEFGFADGTVTLNQLLSPSYTVRNTIYASSNGSQSNVVAPAGTKLVLTGNNSINATGNNIQSNNGSYDSLNVITGNATFVGGGQHESFTTNATIGTVTTIKNSNDTDQIHLNGITGFSYTTSAATDGSLVVTLTSNLGGTVVIDAGANDILGESIYEQDPSSIGTNSYLDLGTLASIIFPYVTTGPIAESSATSIVMGSGIERLALTGSGNDTAVGNNSAINYITANSGNDSIVAGTGSDSLFAGAGSDTLVSGEFGTGQTTLEGGTANGYGATTYVIDPSSGATTIYCGPTDTLVFSSAIDMSTLTYNYGTSSTFAASNLNYVNLAFGTPQFIELPTGTLLSWATYIAGTYTAGSYQYTAVSGAAAAGVTNFYVDGSAQHVVATGNSLNDVITDRSTLGNLLIAGTGNDTLIAGSGNDSLEGSTGTTTYVIGSNKFVTQNTVTSVFYSGASDVLDLSNVISVDKITATSVTTNSVTVVTLNLGTQGEVVIQGGNLNQVRLAGGTMTTLTQLLSQTSINTGNTLYSWGNATLPSGYSTLVLSGTANISGTSNGGNDTIVSNSGVDTLNGGYGDVFVVNNSADVINVVPNYGSDTEETTVSVTAATNIQNLTDVGVGGVTLTGNALNDVITAAANDTLIAGAGAVKLIGADGAVLQSGTGIDTLVGNNSASIIIENTADVVEGAAGIEQSFVSWTATAGVGSLDGVGSASIELTGNSTGCSLQANSGNDTLVAGNGNYIGTNYLFGGTGNDVLIGGANFMNWFESGTGLTTMQGGSGQNVFVVNNSGDVILDSNQSGNDVEQAYVSATIATNLKTLIAESTGITITGNSAANTITSYSAGDTLVAGTGATTLVGGGLSDTFYINSSLDVIKEIYVGTGGVGGKYYSSANNTEYSSVSTTLAANVFTLIANGTNSLVLTGNNVAGAANTLEANGVSDELIAGGAVTTLVGGAGNDTMVGNAAISGGLATTYLFNVGNGNLIIENSTSNDVLELGAGIDANSLSATSTTGTVNGVSGQTIVTLQTIGGNSIVLDAPALTKVQSTNGSSTTISALLAESGTTMTSAASAVMSPTATRLILTGTANISGTGNALADLIVANQGNDTLIAGTGIATLVGGSGTDTFVVDNSLDFISSASATSVEISSATVTLAGGMHSLTGTGSNAITLTGNSLNDTIVGGSGNDTLVAGIGNDTLQAGAGSSLTTMVADSGNDTFVVNSVNDVISVGSGLHGTYTETTSVSTTLAAGVQNLVAAAGTTAYTLTGNATANTITANGGADTLIAGSGISTMVGGAGNDVFIVNNAADVITEAANTGNNTEQTSVSVTLAANVQNLVGTGSTALALTGSSTASTITANNAGDTLIAGSGLSTLIGGTGNDVFEINNVADVITKAVNTGNNTEQSSVTTILAANVQNLTGTGFSNITLTGNSLANTITANNGADTLVAGSGLATLVGSAGNDTFVVNTALDVISEASNTGSNTEQASVSVTLAANVQNLTGIGTGNITLTGNALANKITANSGNDTLIAGSGVATLVGGVGNDTFVVDNASDVIVEVTNTGNNTEQTSLSMTLAANVQNLTGIGSSAMTLTGNTLNNVITANNAADKLVAGSGNDTLVSGTGVDTLVGGTGNDTFVVNNAADVVSKGVNTGNYIEQTSVSVTLASNVEHLVGLGTSDLTLTGASTAGTIAANSGNDTLIAGNGLVTMIGGTGNDTFYINNALDVINQATINSKDVEQSKVSTTLAANLQNLTGMGTNNITLTGNNLADTITANSGQDTLVAGSGLATLNGGAGNTFVINNAADVINESSSTGYNSEQSSVSTTLATNVQHLVGTGANAITLTGNSVADTIVANSGNDTLIAGSGLVTMTGGAGNDTFVLNNSADVVTGVSATSNNTELTSASCNMATNVQTLTVTGTASVNIHGNASNDLITLNSGNDTVISGSGNETVVSGTGVDALVGGTGNDTFVINNVLDTVSHGATGNNTLQSSVSYTAATNFQNLVGSGSGNITLTGNGTTTQNNVITANTGVDSLVGGAGVDAMIGNSGAVTMKDTAGANAMVAGSGNATMIGGTGTSFMAGGAGTDTITLGTGKTVVEFNTGDGAATITAAATLNNTLSLGGGIAYANLSFTKSGNNLILNTGGANSITFTNWYLGAAYQEFSKLQVIEQAASTYNASSTNALYSSKVEGFNFTQLVSAFNTAGSPPTWSLAGSLAGASTGGSNTAALGGDLAYYDGLNGNLNGLNLSAAAATLQSSSYETSAQTIDAWSTVGTGINPLMKVATTPKQVVSLAAVGSPSTSLPNDSGQPISPTNSLIIGYPAPPTHHQVVPQGPMPESTSLHESASTHAGGLGAKRFGRQFLMAEQMSSMGIHAHPIGHPMHHAWFEDQEAISPAFKHMGVESGLNQLVSAMGSFGVGKQGLMDVYNDRELRFHGTELAINRQ